MSETAHIVEAAKEFVAHVQHGGGHNLGPVRVDGFYQKLRRAVLGSPFCYDCTPSLKCWDKPENCRKKAAS